MNIYCIGRNYVNHAKELGNDIPTKPVVFLKTTASLRSFEEAEIAFSTETFHFEGELVLKVGKNHILGEKISHDSIEAIALGIDLTRREEQSELKKAGLPWTSSKSFKGSSILGTFHDLSLFDDLTKIKFEFYLNGELKQSGDTSLMLFSIEEIVNYLNSFSPLEKGDLIYTGTPEGVGEIRKGDKFKLTLPHLAFEESGIL